MSNTIRVRGGLIPIMLVILAVSLTAFAVGADKDTSVTPLSEGSPDDEHTVNFYVPSGTGWVILDTATTSDGLVKELMEYMLDPADYGKLSFLGWYTSEGYNPNDTMEGRFDYSTKITEDTNLYAHFSTKYLVTFAGADGSVFKTLLYEAGMTISESTLRDISEGVVPESGKRFDVWYYDGAPVTGSLTVNENKDLVPHFVDYHYVVFVSSGTQVNPQIIVANGVATKPVNPTRTGYTFRYWSLSEGGTEYAFSTPITGNIILYSVWAPVTVSYQVAYWFETLNTIFTPFTPGTIDPAYYDNENFSYYNSTTVFDNSD